MNLLNFIFKPSGNISNELTVSRMEALRRAASRAQPPDKIIGGKIKVTDSGWQLEIPRGGAGGAAAEVVSRFQITKTKPPFYDGDPLEANEFFISTGLYNGSLPTNMDAKHAVTVAEDTPFYFWVEVDISSTNPSYATSIEINKGTTLPEIDEIAANVFPDQVYVPIGYVQKSSSGSFTIVNYGNGNIGAGIAPSRYVTTASGDLNVYYGFTFYRGT